jgi:DNA modification methylase
MSYTIINGDSNEVFVDVLRSYENIIVVSDPPFNIGYHYNKYHDKMNEDDYYEMLGFLFGSTPSVVIHYPEALYKLAFQMGKFPERVVSWVYNSNTAKQHRDIAFFDVKPDFKAVRQPYKNPNDKRIQKRIAEGKLGAKLYDWWNINQVKNVSKDKTKHPCQMPLEVMKNIIGILPKNAVIVDPFMGSGTTGLACLELGRQFVGIELDKEYFDIAEKRLKEAVSEYVVL